MSITAEHLYDEMNSEENLKRLLGRSEDADFDCKVWPERAEAARGTLAKAACGFANATGGVVIIGLKAAGRGADNPDVVQELVPVADRGAVLSSALDIVLKFVEPGIEGVKAKSIPVEKSQDSSGYVLIFIPSTEGPVRRSRHDWRFYVRIASGTVPMEYFQIEDRFGRRPAPRLVLVLQQNTIVPNHGYDQQPLRLLDFGLRNEGRGIAKFPGIRFRHFPGLKKEEFGVDGNGGFGLPPRPSESQWITFRGGVDDVIYPNETRLIGKLIQAATKKAERPLNRAGIPFFDDCERIWVCEPGTLQADISAEGVATRVENFELFEDTFIEHFKIKT